MIGPSGEHTQMSGLIGQAQPMNLHHMGPSSNMGLHMPASNANQGQPGGLGNEGRLPSTNHAPTLQGNYFGTMDEFGSINAFTDFAYSTIAA
ncbi:hypothetical protein M422DRAFT_262583 [Sphaerobolus stellatus SS14]|uniref:Unplaced genomic scaffold SPHSTscaffold_116, whole genome shotgun sequence n=1 Tax=Sphaerobolus stellatus (strain SS14) TaxID=990650 RepID=A0A0C9VCE2_SPHS4|nr:hypothetical protein M422DRAFT_262583 [Sphaerobolus stellatus SS14]